MRPNDNQLQQLKLFHRQQSASHGAGAVLFGQAGASFVPVTSLYTLPADRQRPVQRMIDYATSRRDDSFVIVADRELLIIAPEQQRNSY